MRNNSNIRTIVQIGDGGGGGPGSQSRFFLFLEGLTDSEKSIEAVFVAFGEQHPDTVVRILKPFHNDYVPLRRKFGIESVPAFALVAYPSSPSDDVRVVVQRGFFSDRYFKDPNQLANLVSDFHNLCVDGLLTEALRKQLGDKIAQILKTTWNEVKGIISITAST